MTNSNDLNLLESQLAALLSFDVADAADVIENMLSFESEDDLLDYMCALLGEATPEVKLFVSNIVRFQQGLPVQLEASSSLPSSSDNGKTAKQNSRQPEEKEREVKKKRRDREMKQQRQKEKDEKLQQQRQKQAEREQKRRDEEEKQRQLDQVRRDQEEALVALKRKQQQQQQQKQQQQQQQKKNEKQLKQDQINNKTKPGRQPGNKNKSVQKSMETKHGADAKPAKPSPPKKGKAKFVCGCFGTIYKPLTNCLHCGRIICEREGYGYCPHCGHLIEEVAQLNLGPSKPNHPDDAKKEAALKHKERLLKFDREYTKRTVVYDDQADYFQNSASTWLTEDEQKDAQLKEEKRRKDMHTIKKQVLNIQF